METIKKKLLLGTNEETKEIYFGSFEITTRNSYKEFTASFYVGTAFNIDDIESRCESYWECLDDTTKLDLLNDGEITKEDIFDEWNRYGDYHDFVDCSCTDIELTTKNGDLINFETSCCGQHDIRENEENYKNIIFTDKKAVETLLKLWDLYHLKNIEDNEEEIEKDINFIIEKIGKYTIHSKETEDFIKENI